MYYKGDLIMEGYIIPAKEAKEITAAAKNRARELKKL